jgi:hypothetical protein
MSINFAQGNAPTEILQLGILSEGGIFDYEPDDNIYPFTDIRPAPHTWGNARLTVQSVIINGNIISTPRGTANTTATLVEPAGGWYASAGYVNFTLWNGWYSAHNRLTDVVSNVSNIDGELVTGFTLPNNAPITSIEVEFAVSRMPNGNPPPCSGNPLTCRADNCNECAIEFIPPSENATLSVIIDGNNNVISYLNDLPVSGSFAYVFNISGGANEVLWDIVPGNLPPRSIPLFLRNTDTGDVNLTGALSQSLSTRSVFATQDFFGCPHEIKITGMSIRSVQVMGACRCDDIVALCQDCKNIECTCCSVCDNNPVGECCRSCGRVCGSCETCDPRGTNMTLRVVIDEVNGIIRYYNNTTILANADFVYRFSPLREQLPIFCAPTGLTAPASLTERLNSPR